MSRSLHRLLVLAALTLAIAGGWWSITHATAAAHEGVSPSDHGATLALVERVAEPGIVGTRMRTSSPGSAAAAPRRMELGSALPSRLAHHATESPRRLPLYTLLRSLRI